MNAIGTDDTSWLSMVREAMETAPKEERAQIETRFRMEYGKDARARTPIIRYSTEREKCRDILVRYAAGGTLAGILKDAKMSPEDFAKCRMIFGDVMAVYGWAVRMRAEARKLALEDMKDAAVAANIRLMTEEGCKLSQRATAFTLERLMPEEFGKEVASTPVGNGGGIVVNVVGDAQVAVVPGKGGVFREV